MKKLLMKGHMTNDSILMMNEEEEILSVIWRKWQYEGE